MQRLTTRTLPAFLAGDLPAFVLFGAPVGEPTMRQAIEFADTWADLSEEAAFGYVDAFESVEAARRLGVRVLPTTVLVIDGAISATFEGVHTSHRLSEALSAAHAPRARAA